MPYQIHLFEYLIYPLLWRVFVLWQIKDGTNHLIDGFNYCHHLSFADETIAIQVIEAESPCNQSQEYADQQSMFPISCAYVAHTREN